MLSDFDLTDMGATQALTLTETGTITRYAVVDDGAGGVTRGAATATTLACRIGPAGKSGEERLIAERVAPQMAYTLTFAAGADVRESDTIVVGSRSFEVAGVVRHTFETARRVVCTEVL
jgi:hypothetical protein